MEGLSHWLLVRGVNWQELVGFVIKLLGVGGDMSASGVVCTLGSVVYPPVGVVCPPVGVVHERVWYMRGCGTCMKWRGTCSSNFTT